MQIDIDPPAFGPLRLGMTEAESVEVLRTLGELRPSGAPQTHFAVSTSLMISATSENDSVFWIAGGPMENDGVVRFPTPASI